MVNIEIEAPGAQRRALEISRFPCLIGRQGDLDWQMTGWRVAREHALLERKGSQLHIQDMGSLAGTWVNGERILRFGPLRQGDVIRIGTYQLHLVRLETSPREDLPLQTPDQPSLPPFLRQSPVPIEPVGVAKPDPLVADPALVQQWHKRLHARLLATIDFRRHDIQGLERPALEALVRGTLAQLIDEEQDLPQQLAAGPLIDSVCHEAIGLGPLESLLSDPEVSEIMVNGIDPIFVERAGQMIQTSSRFSSAEAVRSVIERIVAPLGRRIDDASPMADARLSDGSRVNAIIPPLAINGPCLTIRRFNRQMLGPADLLRLHSASPAMIDFLCEAVRSRLNIVVSGGTGSGKTTLLNILSAMIGAQERVVTIEDAAELRLQHRNLVSLEARPVNIEGRGLVEIRDLVRNALRMRPDRIVIGECRGGEALDMLQAMNTGHDGSLTTVHANNPRDVISRLETMTLMSGFDLPVQAIREQIASAIDLVVHQARGADGRRRIVEISEITGMEGSTVLMQTLFRYQRDCSSDSGSDFMASGETPHFLGRLDNAAERFPLAWFGARP